MNLLVSHDQHELGYFTDDDTDIHFTRRAARAVIRNDENQVALMHFAKTGSYKLPGGGIDEGESIVEALHREVREESGFEITNVQELGLVEEDRYYCGMHQTSYCFAAKAQKFVGTELTEKEAAEGMELRWMDSIDLAIAAIENNGTVDEDGDQIGLAMMKLREIAILNASKYLDN